MPSLSSIPQRQWFYADNYGARGDWNGSTGTDDASALQACINAAVAAGGVVVLSPGKRYKVGTTLSVGSGTRTNGTAIYSPSGQDGTVHTSGSWYLPQAQILADATAMGSTDLLYCNKVPCDLYNIGLGQTNTTTRRSGAAYHADTVYNTTISNCAFSGHAHGIRLTSIIYHMYIDRVYVQGCTTGIGLEAGASAPSFDHGSIHITRTVVTGNAQYGAFTTGVSLEGAATAYLNQLEIVSGASTGSTGLTMGQTAECVYVQASNIQSESSVHSYALGQYVNSCQFVNTWAGHNSPTGSAWYLDRCSGIQIDNAMVHYSQGFELAAAGDVSISGGRVSSWSTGTTRGSRKGFVLSGACSRVSLTGNQVYSSAAGIDYGAGSIAGLIVNGNWADTAASNTATRDAATNASVAGNVNF